MAELLKVGQEAVDQRAEALIGDVAAVGPLEQEKAAKFLPVSEDRVDYLAVVAVACRSRRQLHLPGMTAKSRHVVPEVAGKTTVAQKAVAAVSAPEEAMGPRIAVAWPAVALLRAGALGVEAFAEKEVLAIELLDGALPIEVAPQDRVVGPVGLTTGERHLPHAGFCVVVERTLFASAVQKR